IPNVLRDERFSGRSHFAIFLLADKKERPTNQQEITEEIEKCHSPLFSLSPVIRSNRDFADTRRSGNHLFSSLCSLSTLWLNAARHLEQESQPQRAQSSQRKTKADKVGA